MATPAAASGFIQTGSPPQQASEGTFKNGLELRVPASQTGNSLTGICKKRPSQIPVRRVSFYFGDPERRLRVVRMETELEIAESFPLDRTTNRER
jgi:hypothetical protein